MRKNEALGIPRAVRTSFVRALVEAERERERVAAGVRDVEEFADRGNVGLAIRAVETFGDVEDDVGASGAESFGEFFGRLEGDDVAERGERRRDGSDRFGGIPFRIDVVWY